MPNDKRPRFGEKFCKFLKKKKDNPNQPNDEVLYEEFPELKEKVEESIGLDEDLI